MRFITQYLLLLNILLCLASCEKDFVYDEDCNSRPGGNVIPPWNNGGDTTVTHKKDTIIGGFEIKVDEWGDTIRSQIMIN